MAIGTKVRQLLHLPGVHITSSKEKCISCKKCDKACPMGLKVSDLVSGEKSFGTECIQCGACVDNCPKKVLYYSFKKEEK